MRNDITGIQALAPVTRRIDRPVESIMQAFEARQAPLPTGGPIETRSRWSPVASSPVPAWEARARLTVRREVLRRWSVRWSTALRVELAAWSQEVSELSVWPAAPAFTRWGRRRQDRYFDAVHGAADAAAAALATGGTHGAPPVRLVGLLQPAGFTVVRAH